MKILINTSILLIILNNLSFPQFNADSVTPDYVIEFMKIADESITYLHNYKIPKDFSERDLSHITKLYFQCYEKNPVGFYGYIEAISELFIKSYFNMKDELIPWMKVYYLRNQIAIKYGIAFTEVISTPAFLRCKYVDDNLSFLDTARVISTSMKIYFYFVIEDVLKGGKFFDAEDTIVINSVIGGPDNPRPLFEKQKSYLIPVKPFILRHNEYKGENTFDNLEEVYDVWEMDKPPKTFPIENEIIKNCEYFGVKDTSWTDFKKYFKETYLIFE